MDVCGSWGGDSSLEAEHDLEVGFRSGGNGRAVVRTR
jgi:hypothetical protein